MIDEKVYHNLCTKQELQDGVDLCKEQDLRYAVFPPCPDFPQCNFHLTSIASLNLFYTMGTITANVAALPVGTILDRYGSRSCCLVGCAVLATGSLLMAASFSRPNFDGYIAGNVLLALGGTFIFVPSFRIAHAFPKYAGTIVALVTGAFDASAAVYLFYRLVYERNPRVFKPKWFFLAYLAVPAFIFVAFLTIMPTHDYQTADQLQVKIQHAEDETRDVHESDEEIEDDAELYRVRSERAEHRRDKLHMINTVLGDKSERKRRQVWEQKCQETSRVGGVLHGLPAHKQVATPWFILMLLMTALQMLRMNYFIATVRSQYRYMLHSKAQAEKINHLFDVALPVGGVAFTPFIGLLLDHLSVPATLAFIVFLTTTVGILNSISDVWTGYLTIILFVLLRPYYYSAMS